MSRGCGGFRTECRVPVSENDLEVFIEHARAGLMEQLCAVRRPLHLLFLPEPLARLRVSGRDARRIAFGKAQMNGSVDRAMHASMAAEQDHGPVYNQERL